MNTVNVLQDCMYHLQELFFFLCSDHLNRIKIMLHIFFHEVETVNSKINRLWRCFITVFLNQGAARTSRMSNTEGENLSNKTSLTPHMATALSHIVYT